MSKARRGLATKNATPRQTEETAQLCEKFTKVFPILYPNESITRKMHVLSIVAPKQIRKFKCYYKMLKMEQMGEYLHCKLNQLGTVSKKILYVSSFDPQPTKNSENMGDT